MPPSRFVLLILSVLLMAGLTIAIARHSVFDLATPAVGLVLLIAAGAAYFMARRR